MLKGAIFDFDGTLFDTMFIWNTAGETYLRSIGIEPREDLRKVLKTMSLLQSATYIREKYAVELTLKEIMDGINRTVEDFYFYTVQPKECVITLLEQMKVKGIKMCIATATDRYQVEAALKRCGMESFFSEIFTCSDVGHGKDEPIIFQKAMDYLGTTRENTVVFEDAYHAAKTAKADGFVTVAVYDSHEEKQKELQALSDFYFENYTETDTFWKFAYGL
ncbi:MAG: HAD family phosphatase [Clostridia bacterium]|nr:HAD family phosphatase [Clostridia bacterium]